jgi:hypothetical protein
MKKGNGIYGAKQTKAKVEFDRRRRVVWGPEQSEASKDVGATV